MPKTYFPAVQRMVHTQHPLRPHEADLKSGGHIFALLGTLPPTLELGPRLRCHPPGHRPHAVGEVIRPVRRGDVIDREYLLGFDDDRGVRSSESLGQAGGVAGGAEAIFAAFEVADTRDDRRCIDFPKARPEGLDEAADELEK